MAAVCSVDERNVVIQGVIGDSQTSVSCSIATADAKTAAELARTLSNELMQNGLGLQGFLNCSLDSVKVTGCIPGFELSENQTCQLCPAASFCVGGSIPSMQCSAGHFAMPGSNASTDCKPAVFVAIVVSFPTTKNNLTDSVTMRFQIALASAAGVSVQSVFMLTAVQGNRRSDKSSMHSRRSGESSFQISAEIAAANVAEAESIINNISPSVLQSCLLAQGLFGGSLQSLTIPSINSVTNQGIALPIIVGAFVGSLVVLICSVGIFLLRKVESGDERELRCTMEKLRVKLGITVQDGYLLGYNAAISVFLLLFLFDGVNNLSCPLSAQKPLQYCLALSDAGFRGISADMIL